MIESFLGNESPKPNSSQIYTSVQCLLIHLPRTKENEKLLNALADWKTKIDHELSLIEYKPD